MTIDDALSCRHLVVVYDDQVPGRACERLLLEGVKQPAQAQGPPVRCHHHADGDKPFHGCDSRAPTAPRHRVPSLGWLASVRSDRDGARAQVRYGCLVAGAVLDRFPAKARRIYGRVRRLPVSIGYFRGPLLMSALRKRWVVFRNPDATIRFGAGTYLGPGFSLHMPFGGTFATGEGVEFRRDFRAELGGPDARIEFGPGCSCTYGVLIQCSTTIEIGARCMFGQSTIVIDGNHRFRDLDRPMLEQGYDFRAIHIADDATITSKCTIIANVGARAFVGANAVVTRPIPPYSVAAGVPARVIEYFGPA